MMIMSGIAKGRAHILAKKARDSEIIAHSQIRLDIDQERVPVIEAPEGYVPKLPAYRSVRWFPRSDPARISIFPDV